MNNILSFNKWHRLNEQVNARTAISPTSKSISTPIIKKVINEDNLGGGGTDGMGRGTGYHRETVNSLIKNSYKFDKDKMATGSDDVDVSKAEYMDLKQQLQIIVNSTKVKNPINVKVTGGASAVGSSSGFNNEELAKRRAVKLIQQLRKDIPDIDKKITFIPEYKVGKATIYNSPEAYKEQYVNVSFDTNDIQYIKQNIELDNTTTNSYPNRDVTDNRGKFNYDAKMKRVCLRIPEKYVTEFRKKVREFKNSHLDINDIPFGVYDIKEHTASGFDSIGDASYSAFKSQGHSHRGRDDEGESYIMFDGEKYYVEDFKIADYNDMGIIPRVEGDKLIIANPAWGA